MSDFDQPDSLNQVAEFHQAFGAPVLAGPQTISPERAALRVSLLQEELDELKTAIAEDNLLEIADALADLQYVLSGAILEFGLGKKFSRIFNEVHRSNMSKACNTEVLAENTVKSYQEKGIETYSRPAGKVWTIHRTADDKVLKSNDYSPADLKKILDEN